MTTFTSSRLGVFGRLLGFPFIVAAYAFRAAAAEVRTEFGALRYDFVPAVRYIATGNPEKSLAAHAGDKVLSLRDRIRLVFETYAADRLIALFLLLAMPFLAFYMICMILKDEDFFPGLWAAIVECSKAIVTGEKIIS